MGAPPKCGIPIIMKRALMMPSDIARYNRARKGRYRRRTDVPIGKPVKGKRLR